MLPNDIITIYEDPLTEKKSEGKAKLIECLDRTMGTFGGRNIERWLLEFVDYPGGLYERNILAVGKQS